MKRNGQLAALLGLVFAIAVTSRLVGGPRFDAARSFDWSIPLTVAGIHVNMVAGQVSDIVGLPDRRWNDAGDYYWEYHGQSTSSEPRSLVRNVAFSSERVVRIVGKELKQRGTVLVRVVVVNATVTDGTHLDAIKEVLGAPDRVLPSGAWEYRKMDQYVLLEVHSERLTGIVLGAPGPWNRMNKLTKD